MSGSVSYTIQASAAPATAMVRVRIKCSASEGSHRWRLDMPRLLWSSMGTEEAAAFITERYFDAYPAVREPVGPSHISWAIATSLLDADQFFGPNPEG
ncbi:hypothetical protein F0P96_16880 [Hymenobacter busanensis]|uniref:Uncharacterized protein n=1 Tax=Hymenobacter busanensis TaxID=2607656 RepID=A0A7L4ZRZ1_9BACT|nr:hypothetical protein [Hymenobacter busanensis]KAA9327651.1 hypothetical protein F0P96_16880 [Hymenobacter busanensis]QHJ06009.1 hypothetical protein GUY19_01350 [Hymenobacter busanensis]